jgi:hypothetical protein
MVTINTEPIVALLSPGTAEAVISQTAFWKIRIKFQVLTNMWGHAVA